MTEHAHERLLDHVQRQLIVAQDLERLQERRAMELAVDGIERGEVHETLSLRSLPDPHPPCGLQGRKRYRRRQVEDDVAAGRRSLTKFLE